jgi:hypothetical protein
MKKHLLATLGACAHNSEQVTFELPIAGLVSEWVSCRGKKEKVNSQQRFKYQQRRGFGKIFLFLCNAE